MGFYIYDKGLALIFSGIPLWLMLVIAAGAVSALVGLHFLHRNYSRLLVPTLIFWQALSQSSLYNRLWRRFRQWLTFILLAAILLLLVFSMTRPFLVSANQAPIRYAIILDCRASMGLIDAGFKQSRLDRAKVMCEELLKNYSDFDKTMLITATGTAKVVTGFADNKAAGLYALKHLEISQYMSNNSMRQALETAQAAIADNSQTHIIVFTDHAGELENLPAKTKKHLSIFNVAKPITNAAILQSAILPVDNNQSQMDITVGYWGQNATAGVIELYENDILQQKQNISLSPDTIEQHTFIVRDATTKTFSAKLVCDDEFKNDNYITIQQDIGRRVYIAEDAPAPLKSYIDADTLYHRVNSPADADISIIQANGQTNLSAAKTIYIVGNGEPLVSAAKIIPTTQLYPDENKRDAIGNELYAIGGSSLNSLLRDAVPLLTTEDGKTLAAVDKKGQVYLADSLFADQATFWKQPQFPELMQRIMEVARGDDITGAKIESAKIEAEYANLWNIGTPDNSGMSAEPQKQPVPLYKYIIITVLLFLSFEIYAFYKGTIV
jgi:hypothetical protein